LQSHVGARARDPGCKQGTVAFAQYRDGYGRFPPGFKLVPFGDAAALESPNTPHTAALLIEPIQGEGGIAITADFHEGRPQRRS
jgi:acetylornithine/succinyldiaminopimelate/putrescine aminotransferase